MLGATWCSEFWIWMRLETEQFRLSWILCGCYQSSILDKQRKKKMSSFFAIPNYYQNQSHSDYLLRFVMRCLEI